MECVTVIFFLFFSLFYKSVSTFDLFPVQREWMGNETPTYHCLSERRSFFNVSAKERRLGYDGLRARKVAEKPPLSLKAIQVHFFEIIHVPVSHFPHNLRM